jgi:hypothetical protein
MTPSTEVNNLDNFYFENFYNNSNFDSIYSQPLKKVSSVSNINLTPKISRNRVFSDQLKKEIIFNHSSKLKRGNSFLIQRDIDTIYDYENIKPYNIKYKKYGQFISIENTSEPDEKQIIDIFELYELLKKRKKENKKTFSQKISNFFK